MYMLLLVIGYAIVYITAGNPSLYTLKWLMVTLGFFLKNKHFYCRLYILHLLWYIFFLCLTDYCRHNNHKNNSRCYKTFIICNSYSFYHYDGFYDFYKM